MARALRALLLVASLAASALADPAAIVAFNNEAQQAVREYGIQSQISSRIYALTHLAQYTAIDADADPALQTAQAAYAGYTVLNILFPWRFAKLGKAIAPLLEGLPAEDLAVAEEAGRAAGIAAVEAGLGDGFDRYVPFTPAEPGSAPGQYQFAPDQTYSLYPQIATTVPLVLDSVEEYTPAPPLEIPSDEYTTQLAEVFDLGAKESASRSQEQTDTANFWADGNTTSAVAGHFNQIAQALLSENVTVHEAALLFAVLNAAQWDASIAAYKAKYDLLFWRPVTAIREGDGSEETAAYVNPEWTSLLKTPSHPEYPSGHSATAGASGAVIAALLGEDAPFTIGSEYKSAEGESLPERTYAGIQEAVDEVNESRIYGGVHFRHAVEEGAKLGASVAQAVLERFEDKFASASGQPYEDSFN